MIKKMLKVEIIFLHLVIIKNLITIIKPLIENIFNEKF